jgi:hypothetical protein
MEHYASRSFAFWAFLRFSLAIVVPMNVPMTPRPATSKNAGRRTAHSLSGKYWCIGLDASKNGWGKDDCEYTLADHKLSNSGTDQENRPCGVVDKNKGSCQQHGAAKDLIASALFQAS